MEWYHFMLEDMNMRRFVPDTQREHIRAVEKFAST